MNNVKNIEWKKITAREYGVQYSEMQIRSLTDKVKDYLPYTTYNQIMIPEGNNECFLIDKSCWDELVQSLHDNFIPSIDKLDKFEKQFREFGKEYVNISEKISKMNLEELNNRELKELYMKYQKKLLKYSVFVWAGFILNNSVAKKAKQILENYLKKYSKKKKAKIIDLVFKPSKKASALQFQEDISKLGENFSEEKLHELYLKYRWLPCLDIHNKPWPKKEFKDHVKSFEVKKKKQVRTRPINRILNDLKIKENDRPYIKMARRFTYIMDARDDFRRKGVFNAQKLFKEIGKRMDIELKDTSYLQEREIIKFLDKGKKITISVIKDRQDGFVLYFDDNNNIVCEQGRSIDGTLIKLGVEKPKGKIKEIKGVAASSGKRDGKTTIVKGVDDLNKIKNGDVMVAVTTHPDYVPAMRKVVAIVTDEGGIACHTAIVSRELKIPCVTGTKIATKVLEDGDKVEVDAEEGIVRKLRGNHH